MSALPPNAEPLPARPQRLRRRADFVAAAKGKRAHMRNFSLQGRLRAEAGPARFGFTVTKKVGGAVERNRIRRRLKEALRLAPDLATQHDHDYVIVARRESLSAAFPDLQGELRRGLAKLQSPAKLGPPNGAAAHQTATTDRASKK